MRAASQTTTLAPQPTSPSTARRFVISALTTWGIPEPLDTVVLLVSELVTNGVLHARTPMRLEVKVVGGTLRVEVHDGSSAPAVHRDFAADATTGRGLPLVDMLSDAWGVNLTGDGKAIWFELYVGRPVDRHADDSGELADRPLRGGR